MGFRKSLLLRRAQMMWIENVAEHASYITQQNPKMIAKLLIQLFIFTHRCLREKRAFTYPEFFSMKPRCKDGILEPPKPKKEKVGRKKKNPPTQDTNVEG